MPRMEFGEVQQIRKEIESPNLNLNIAYIVMILLEIGLHI